MVAGLFYVTLLLGTVDALDVNQTFLSKSSSGSAVGVEQYTDNWLCRRSNCVNPVFPGLDDMPRLESLTWQCSTLEDAGKWMNFCKDSVGYPPAVPNPKAKDTPISNLVKAMDDAAMTMFFYHLTGMGYDSWNYRNPSDFDDECVRSVWKMACFTYFPRANAGCKSGEVSFYQRPCRSCCENYVKQCGVECCDESVQCSYTHVSYKNSGGQNVSVLETGYVDAEGPSASCTGAARRSTSSPFYLILALFGFHWALGAASSESRPASRATATASGSRLFKRLPVIVLLVCIATFLQGCSEVPTHKTGNWRQAKNYLGQYSFAPVGGASAQSFLNSCSDPDLPPTQQCSGRGYCRGFALNSVEGMPGIPLAFCSCDDAYADPECSTERKSQFKAFLWSIFLGMFGADYFYLGFPVLGLFKLFTLGGCGIWWLTDIVRIASGPVYADKFRVRNDLDHAWAILIIISLCAALGVIAAVEQYMTLRANKRKDLEWLRLSEENDHFKRTQEHLSSKLHQKYGALRDTYQPPVPTAGGFARMYPEEEAAAAFGASEEGAELQGPADEHASGAEHGGHAAEAHH